MSIQVAILQRENKNTLNNNPMNCCITALHVTCWQPYLYLLPDQCFAQHSATKARHHQWCLWRHAWNTQALKDVSLQATNPKPRLCTTEVQVMHVQKCSSSACSQTYCDISSGLVRDGVVCQWRTVKAKRYSKGYNTGSSAQFGTLYENI